MSSLSTTTTPVVLSSRPRAARLSSPHVSVPPYTNKAAADVFWNNQLNATSRASATNNGFKRLPASPPTKLSTHYHISLLPHADKITAKVCRNRQQSVSQHVTTSSTSSCHVTATCVTTTCFVPDKNITPPPILSVMHHDIHPTTITALYHCSVTAPLPYRRHLVAIYHVSHYVTTTTDWPAVS
ncbi:hypothetical protein CPB83DRAFT_903570 [Crepidotus variabilis]|uniref:Uncharacterized protein n=1 Tax=Crepidotus variabilis TaxID=179855 RepID=A0A9P6EMK0_9AGAR|nr:hypothetical protein CPB83DRAFT_903570 [Crepidotus variabilis]